MFKLRAQSDANSTPLPERIVCAEVAVSVGSPLGANYRDLSLEQRYEEMKNQCSKLISELE